MATPYAPCWLWWVERHLKKLPVELLLNMLQCLKSSRKQTGLYLRVEEEFTKAKDWAQMLLKIEQEERHQAMLLECLICLAVNLAKESKLRNVLQGDPVTGGQ